MNIRHLRHHLLVTTPSLQDALFSNRVTYALSHSNSGAQGFSLDKPLPVSLGYAPWSPSQPDQESSTNDRLIAPYHQTIALNSPINERHNQAIELIGIHSHPLNVVYGHA